MSRYVHLIKVGDHAGGVRRGIAEFDSVIDAYMTDLSFTESEWREACDRVEGDCSTAILSEGLAILGGEDPSPAHTVDMDAFSTLYQRLYEGFGFVGTPVGTVADRQRAIELTAGELRLLTTGIRFLREFYDLVDVDARGVGGGGFITI